MIPVLEVAAAREAPGAAPLHLVLHPGELALVDVPDGGAARMLTRLAAGLPALAAGRVRFLGEDWAALPRRAAERLRGRIGLAPGEGGWLAHLSVEENTLLARRHHQAAPLAALRDAAAALARGFGLDGLPAANPNELSRLDLARAACVRAFLGEPALLLLESPADREMSDALAAPVAAALAPALARGAAAVWTTRSRRAWADPGLPATQRLRLDARAGLVPARAPRDGPVDQMADAA